MCVRVNESSAPKGSSINNTLGCMASARAIPTRCFIPPEISSGLRRNAWDMLTSSRLWRVHSSRSAFDLLCRNTWSTASRTLS